MIVLDASAAIELLLNSPTGTRLATRLKSTEEGIHVPHLIDLEIGQALREFTVSGVVEDHIAANALDDWLSIDVAR